jgi:hypothetical protein
MGLGKITERDGAADLEEEGGENAREWREGGREEIRGEGKGKGGLYTLVARPTDISNFDRDLRALKRTPLSPRLLDSSLFNWAQHPLSAKQSIRCLWQRCLISVRGPAVQIWCGHFKVLIIDQLGNDDIPNIANPSHITFSPSHPVPLYVTS